LRTKDAATPGAGAEGYRPSLDGLNRGTAGAGGAGVPPVAGPRLGRRPAAISWRRGGAPRRRAALGPAPRRDSCPARPHSPLSRAAAAAERGDARRFCEAILPSVSRTFAIGIRALPGDLGRAVLTAYLICRIADTVEDAPGMASETKGPLFDALLAAFDGAPEEGAAAFAAAAGGVTGDPAHLMLVRHAPLVFAHFATLPARTRDIVRRWVTEMAVGMRKFVFLYPDGIRIQTLDEFREYCYYVAGTVGYLLTDLWHEHSPVVGRERYERLRERCRAFAEALQTVNILKDVAHDARVENSVYVPEQLLREHGSSQAALLAADRLGESRSALDRLIRLAWADLDEARAYLLLIPRRALRIRLFCILPLLYAHATLRDLTTSTAMLRPGGSVKISRREVKSLLMTGALFVVSNRLVRWLVARVRRRAFELSWV
jgi:farnesyl-diphosphate farnesyltransferase